MRMPGPRAPSQASGADQPRLKATAAGADTGLMTLRKQARMLARFLAGTGLDRDEVESILADQCPGAGAPQIVAEMYAPAAQAA